MVTFSIIIPTYDRNEDLKNCLQSLRDNSYYENEVIVLHSLLDETTNKLCQQFNAKQIFDNARINNKRVKSLWGILNDGIRSATSNLVMYLNDDCLVVKDWDKLALPYFTDRTALLVLRAKGIGNSPDFRIQYGHFGLPCANYGIIDKRYNIYFDESFNWFYGDADYTLQVKKSSLMLSVACTTEDMVIHNHRIDGNRLVNESDERSRKDEALFHLKWRPYKYRTGLIVKKNVLDYFLIFNRKVSNRILKILRNHY